MAKKKKTSKKKASKGGGGEPLIVASKCKAALKEHDLNVAGDALDGLNKVVNWYIAEAAARCAANNRKTVRAHDFIAGM
jgi:histone H3/H4